MELSNNVSQALKLDFLVIPEKICKKFINLQFQNDINFENSPEIANFNSKTYKTLKIKIIEKFKKELSQVFSFQTFLDESGVFEGPNFDETF